MPPKSKQQNMESIRGKVVLINLISRKTKIWFGNDSFLCLRKFEL